MREMEIEERVTNETKERMNARTQARRQLWERGAAQQGLRATYHLRQCGPGWALKGARRRRGCRPPPISYTASTCAGPPGWLPAGWAPRFSPWHHSPSYPPRFACKTAYSRPGPRFVCGLAAVSTKPRFCAGLPACRSHLEAELLGLKGEGREGGREVAGRETEEKKRENVNEKWTNKRLTKKKKKLDKKTTQSAWGVDVDGTHIGGWLVEQNRLEQKSALYDRAGCSCMHVD